MQRIEGQSITLKIENESWKRLNKIAERRGLTRAQALRVCLDLGIDVHEDFEKVGIVQTVDVVERTRKAIGKFIQPKLV